MWPELPFGNENGMSMSGLVTEQGQDRLRRLVGNR